MERTIDTLNILGLDVDLIIADEVLDSDGIEKEGVNSLALCRIWLCNQYAPSYLRMVLFHEVKELMTRHIDATGGDTHEYFQDFATIEYSVLLANKDILFGDKLARLLSDGQE